MLLLLLTLLILKHLLVDFFWQPEYEWRNKGTCLHFGGISHAIKHIGVTGMILIPFTTPLMVLSMMLLEFVIHYHMDWFKMWWGARKKYDPYHPKFYHWFGIDQYVHTMTYVAIAFLVL